MQATAEPRVMHVTRNLDHGGAQEVLCTLAESRMARSRFFVCTLADGPLRGRLEASGASCAVLPEPRCHFSRPILYAAELRRIVCELAERVAAWQIEVVQTHLLTVLDAAVLRLRRGPTPPALVWTFHGTDFLPLRRGPTLLLRRLACRWMYRVTAHRVDAIVAVSEAVRASLVRQLGAAAERTVVIGNAPSPTKYAGARPAATVREGLGLEPGSRVVIFLGRLVVEKGCRYLLEAMPAVIARVPSAITLIAGDGPERERLEALARRTDTAGRVRFLGHRDDVADLLAAADVACLPSLREGFALALVEAMAAGKAVVATDIAASRAVVEDGAAGLLVAPADPAQLAAGLIALLSDPERARTMGEVARCRVMARYDPKRQSELYASLYRDLVAARTRR